MERGAVFLEPVGRIEQSQDVEGVLQAQRYPEKLREFTLTAYEIGKISWHQLFDRTHLEAEHKISENAAHEIGHGLVTKFLDGVVSKMTVIREGNILGHAVISFHNFHPQERLIRFMASLCGGYVAEERIGKTDHQGTGSDMAHLDHLAEVMSTYFHGGRVAAKHFKERAFSLARAAIYSVSFSNFQERRMNLYQQGTIV